jgi:hypothetical protein
VAPQDYQLGPAVLDASRWLVVGRTLPLSEAAWPMLLFGAFALLGLVLARRSEGTKKEDFFSSSFLRFFVLFVLAALPVILLFVFKLYRDAYLKFLLVCLAPLCLLVANGVNEISQKSKGKSQKELRVLVSVFCLLPLAFLLWPSLNNLYNNPAYARDDYRGIAAMIREGERDDDAVLLIAPNQWEVFTYYFADTAKVFPLRYKPLNEIEAERELLSAMATRKRLFVLFYGEKEADPNGWYERWLVTRANKAEESWMGNIRLAVYAPMNLVAAVKRPQADFGGVIQLRQHQRIEMRARTGDVVAIGLQWLALHKINVNYKVFVHIGKADAPPIAQNDGEPQAGFRPASSWNTNEIINDNRAVWIKPGTPPGQYDIYIGLYDANTGERLKLPDGSDRLKIGEITIVEK